MPPLETGWPSLNVVIFPPVLRLVLDDPKQWPPPKIIDKIHELILKDRRISAKSIAEQLGISHGRVGSIIHEDLVMRSLSEKWVPKCLNADQTRQRCQLSEQLLEFFRPVRSKWFHVGHDWWTWTKPGYITMTRRQSNNQWSGGISSHLAPKHSECKNSLENFSPRFFGIKTASSSLITFQRAKLSTRSFTRHCWCNWRTFWRKKAAESSPKGFCSSTTMPRLTGHLQLRRNWTTWAYSVLITHPILRIWPRRTTTCSLDWKNNWKVAIFRPTWRSLLPRRPGWTATFWIFFWVAFKSWSSGVRSV